MTDHLRVPPHSIDAEQSVIGGLMLAPERLTDIAGWLAVFRQAVREDWLKVWRVMPDGSNVLTTVGEQLRRAA